MIIYLCQILLSNCKGQENDSSAIDASQIQNNEIILVIEHSSNLSISDEKDAIKFLLSSAAEIEDTSFTNLEGGQTEFLSLTRIPDIPLGKNTPDIPLGKTSLFIEDGRTFLGGKGLNDARIRIDSPINTVHLFKTSKLVIPSNYRGISFKKIFADYSTSPSQKTKGGYFLKRKDKSNVRIIFRKSEVGTGDAYQSWLKTHSAARPE